MRRFNISGDYSFLDEEADGRLVLYEDVSTLLEHRAQLLAALKEWQKVSGPCYCKDVIWPDKCHRCKDKELIASIENEMTKE